MRSFTALKLIRSPFHFVARLSALCHCPQQSYCLLISIGTNIPEYTQEIAASVRRRQIPGLIGNNAPAKTKNQHSRHRHLSLDIPFRVVGGGVSCNSFCCCLPFRYPICVRFSSFDSECRERIVDVFSCSPGSNTRTNPLKKGHRKLIKKRNSLLGSWLRENCAKPSSSDACGWSKQVHSLCLCKIHAGQM